MSRRIRLVAEILLPDNVRLTDAELAGHFRDVLLRFPWGSLESTEPLTDAELKRLWAQRNAAKQTPHAGPGRPRTAKRCPCGEMTKARAKQRNHKCSR